MRLAISNIAWDRALDDDVAELLRREGVRGVELAPTKWRESPYDAPAADVAELRRTWEDRGLPIVALQSLLFGRPELQLFGSTRERSAMIDYLRRAADFAGQLGAHALVFGSPRNRVRGSMPASQAMQVARDAMRELAPSATERGVVFCVEANPAPYGCDFVTRTAEAVELCRAVDRDGIGVNADLGGMALGGEDPAVEIANAGRFVAHVHASEPNLAETRPGPAHEQAAEALDRIGYAGWVSIEMRAAPEGGQLAAIARALHAAKRSYAALR